MLEVIFTYFANFAHKFNVIMETTVPNSQINKSHRISNQILTLFCAVEGFEWPHHRFVALWSSQRECGFVQNRWGYTFPLNSKFHSKILQIAAVSSLYSSLTDWNVLFWAVFCTFLWQCAWTLEIITISIVLQRFFLCSCGVQTTITTNWPLSYSKRQKMLWIPCFTRKPVCLVVVQCTRSFCILP